MRGSIAIFAAAISASAVFAHETCPASTNVTETLMTIMPCQTTVDPLDCSKNATGLSTDCLTCIATEASKCTVANCATECLNNGTAIIPMPPACEACFYDSCPEAAETCTQMHHGNDTTAPSGQPTAPTVTFPYSLQGTWATDAVSRGPGYVYCYTVMTTSYTQAVFEEFCKPIAGGADVKVSIYTMANPSVVACGQHEQIGQSYGVFGGKFVSTPLSGNTTFTDDVCFYYSRIDSNHIGAGRNAEVTMAVGKAEMCGNGQICCPMPMPKVTSDRGTFRCQNGDCLTAKSSYCSSNVVVNVWQIGIGMGIGGVGLLFTTLALLLGVSMAHQG